ncbi:SDR family oxidoreductase [Syntrophobacter fumaroxidans]|uniref:Short-chain dehydrogenase/reductase SDR n=1 Tax=Syntrophobacter fumaroxidans (strain DSM 10017 / MPOB) TaxID=335543 RepID=A0LEJ3_SYNFM|nr:SDR family oxidoreductase [Syntrophobacter fumaroxidans]ABK15845.1 short-chain dehydrogenase/reductase SDR [Syntrophobacter fumaroxidans MPOB]
MFVLILGANSDIARAIADKFAREEGAHLCLASRDTDELERLAKDIEVRHRTRVQIARFDALQFASHRLFYESLDPKPDTVVVAFGYLGNQSRAQAEFDEARKIVETNFLGCVSILEIIAEDFEARGRGTILAISSVAGERGRQSNYMYGSAKSALTTYLSGLRNRLYRRNVRVITVLPGFVRSKMTDGLRFPKMLSAVPEETADDVFRAFKSGADEVYTKWFWKWIMTVIRMLPERIFKRLRL